MNKINKYYLIGFLIMSACLWIIYIYVIKGTGATETSDLQNIHGIPYPTSQNHQGILVTESLAHMDLYLQGSPFAKSVHLTLTYTPNEIKNLSLGIRENSFWLSYPKHNLPIKTGKNQHTIAIPITDKLPDSDKSVDLMFFAESSSHPSWILHDITTTVKYDIPSWPEMKNHFKSVISQEKPL